MVMLTRLALALAAVTVTGAGIAARPSPTLTAQDSADIRTLYARYNWAIDSGDADAWATMFTPNGVFVAGGKTYTGHDALVGFAKGFHASIGSHVKHWTSNLDITPTPAGATGRIYLLLVDFGTKPPSIMASASYADELVKTPAGWRFARRTVTDDAAAAPKPR